MLNIITLTCNNGKVQKLDLSFRVLFHWFQVQQIVFDRILLTFSVAIGTKSTNAINWIQPGDTAVSTDNIPKPRRSCSWTWNKQAHREPERTFNWITSFSKGLLNIILLSLKIPRRKNPTLPLKSRAHWKKVQSLHCLLTCSHVRHLSLFPYQFTGCDHS